MRWRRDLRLGVALPPRRIASLGRAVVELAIARIRLNSGHSRDLLRQGRTPALAAPPLPDDQRALVDDVAFAIPRAAERLPWRADCLVQALAAERWLRRRGVATRLTIGVKHGAADPLDAPALLDAHAWLSAGDRIVTGGDVSSFTALGATRPLPLKP